MRLPHDDLLSGYLLKDKLETGFPAVDQLCPQLLSLWDSLVPCGLVSPHPPIQAFPSISLMGTGRKIELATLWPRPGTGLSASYPTHA